MRISKNKTKKSKATIWEKMESGNEAKKKLKVSQWKDLSKNQFPSKQKNQP